MALLKPNQLSPQNSVIDADEDNIFSWSTNGAKQTGYRFYIYNNETNVLVYNSGEIISPVEYQTVPSSTLTNGVDYKWYVTSFAGAESKDSEYEFFTANETPIVEFVLPDFSYGEIRLIDNMNSINDFVVNGATANLSRVNTPILDNYGSYSTQVTANSGTLVSFYKTENLDLTEFQTGTESTDADYIYIICYIEDLAEIDTNGIYVKFETTASDYYEYNFPKTGLEVGWNYLQKAKSGFSPTGSPDWEDITEWDLGFYAVAASDVVYFQALELRKVYTGSTTIYTQDYTFEISYTQNDDVALKAYKFILSNENGVEIIDTDWLYDFNLEYEFTGFNNNTSYQIEGKVLSQNNQEGTTGIRNLNIYYENQNVLPTILTTEYDDNGYTKIDWSNIQYRNATYSPSTPVYVTGEFNYGLEIQGGDTLNIGSLTKDEETEYTITAWIQLFSGYSGNFINIDDTYYFGYDNATSRFYGYDSTNYVYSEVYSLSGLLGDYFFIGLTNDYFIIKYDNALVLSIDLSAITMPTTIDSFKFLGRMYLDNTHGQATKLSYNELLNEDTAYIYSATPIVEAIEYTYYPITSLKISDTENLVFLADGYSSTSGDLNKYDNTGTLLATTPINNITSATYFIDGCMIEVDTNKFILAHCDENDSYVGKLEYISTENGISILDTVTFYSYSISQITLTKMHNGYVLASYLDRSSQYLYAQIINYTDDTLTANEVDEIIIRDGITSLFNSIALNETKAIIYWTTSTNVFQNTIITRNINYLSVGITYTLDDYSGVNEIYKPIKINSNKVALSFKIDNYHYVGITEYNSENLVTNNINKVYTKVSTSRTRSVFSHIQENYYALLINDDNYTGIQIVKIDSNDNIINENNLQISGTNYITASMNPCGTESLFVFYKEGSNEVIQIYSDFGSVASGSNREATWVLNSSRFLANFEESLQAGNWNFEILSFRLKRLASDGSLYQTLGDFSNTILYYDDFTQRNNVDYTYELYTVDEDGNEDLGTSITSSLDFFGWFLTDGTNIYKFDLETNSGSINSNTDMQVYENYTKYPTISFGIKDYRSGKITTNPYSYNSTSLTYNFALALLDEIRDFINNQEIKYLKNTKGEIFKIITSNFSYSYDDKLNNPIYSISFDWIEVGIGEVGVS